MSEKFYVTRNGTRCLIHADKKDHKYIAKVERPNKKWRYFYSRKEYEAYLKKKKVIDKIVEGIEADKGKIEGEDLDQLQNSLEKELSDDVYDNGSISKNKLDRQLSRISDYVYDTKKSFRKTNLERSLYDVSYKVKRKKRELAKTRKGFKVFGSLKRSLKQFKETVKKKKYKISSSEYKNHKYIAKVKLDNGTYRYFYDLSEYESFMKRRLYQNNEPDFMKDVPEIDEPLTAEEDMEKVNPHYIDSVYGRAKGGENYTTNCILCTYAYELRRRGYDVTAAPMTSSLWDKLGNEHYKNFWSNKINDNDVSYQSLLYKNAKVENIPVASDLEKTLSQNPNTRGAIAFGWKGHDVGHTINYEVDSKGKVILRDSQTNKIISSSKEIQKYTKRIKDVKYYRTDNLELNEGVANELFKNRKFKRSVFFDN